MPIMSTIEATYGAAEMILKVKEPIALEYPLIQSHHLVFTYFHFASGEALTRAMIQNKANYGTHDPLEGDKKFPFQSEYEMGHS